MLTMYSSRHTHTVDNGTVPAQYYMYNMYMYMYYSSNSTYSTCSVPPQYYCISETVQYSTCKA